MMDGVFKQVHETLSELLTPEARERGWAFANLRVEALATGQHWSVDVLVPTLGVTVMHYANRLERDSIVEVQIQTVTLVASSPVALVARGQDVARLIAAGRV
jgi:hypothetical protein